MNGLLTDSAAPARRQPMFGRTHRVHMVGIGGIGMSSIAEVLLMRGFAVTGSDLVRSEVTDHLEDRGAIIHVGHDAANVETPDVVVYSSAVDPTINPETVEATRRRIPIIPRAVMLGELMRMKFGIGIAGTHGKTTTTSMAGVVVRAGGFDPTIIVGGKVSAFGSNAVAGEGDIIVIEADEYDRTFLRLTPSLAVITNIEAEHLDIYDGLDDLSDAFVQYANSVPFFGAAIVCLDDENVQRIVDRIDRRVVTYGTNRQAEIRADHIRQEGRTMIFDVSRAGVPLGTVRLGVPGHHNVLNALAAVAVGIELDIPLDEMATGLSTFSGVQRRFHELAEVGGVLVIDDYAHHPTEIVATLETVVATWPDRRVVAVFQPHLYSRTRDFLDAFARSFFNADVLVLMDIYGAREDDAPAITGADLAESARASGHRHVLYESAKELLPARLAAVTRPGDVVVTMGAGDIWRYSRAFVDLLSDSEAGS
jgi:UDP-N-acetylmuramate--alanine ligase